MRKTGILCDTEQTRNRDFKKTQLASREHIASRLAKAKSIEKELKYADRVPARVPGGLVRVNLRETMTGVDRRVYVDKPVAQSQAESNVAQESGTTVNLSQQSQSLLWALATGVIQAGHKAGSAVGNALELTSFPIRGEEGRGPAQNAAQGKKPPPSARPPSARSTKGKPAERLIETKE